MARRAASGCTIWVHHTRKSSAVSVTLWLEIVSLKRFTCKEKSLEYTAEGYAIGTKALQPRDQDAALPRMQ